MEPTVAIDFANGKDCCRAFEHNIAHIQPGATEVTCQCGNVFKLVPYSEGLSVWKLTEPPPKPIAAAQEGPQAPVVES